MDITIRRFNSNDVIKTGNVVKRSNQKILINYYSNETIDKISKKNNPKEFLKSAKERKYIVAEIKDKIVGIMS